MDSDNRVSWRWARAPANKWTALGRHLRIIRFCVLGSLPIVIVLGGFPLLASVESLQNKGLPVSEFWEVVTEGRKKEDESSYRLEIWLEENTDRRVSIKGTVLDVHKQCCFSDDCAVFVKIPTGNTTQLRQDIGMPCSIAGELVRGQEFTAICDINGDWNSEYSVPEFHRCRLKFDPE